MKTTNSMSIVRFKRKAGKKVADIYFSKLHLNFYCFLPSDNRVKHYYGIFHVCFWGFDDFNLNKLDINLMHCMVKIMHRISMSPTLFQSPQLHKHENKTLLILPYSIFFATIL